MAVLLAIAFLQSTGFRSSFDAGSADFPAALNPAYSRQPRVRGFKGTAASLSSGVTLNSVLRSREGAISFWVRTNWSDVSAEHHFLEWGGAGGVLVAKDGAQNLRLILNRFSPSGHGETGLSIPVGTWKNGEWHHVAATWSASRNQMMLALDGRIERGPIGNPLYSVSATRLRLAGSGQTWDELLLGPYALKTSGVEALFWDAVKLTSLAIALPDSIPAAGWPVRTNILATVNGRPVEPPPTRVALTTSTPSVVGFVDGVPISREAGPASLSVRVGASTATRQFSVPAPVRLAETLAIPSDLATPRPGALWEVPIACVFVVPTQDGVNVDPGVADWTGTVNRLRDDCVRRARLRKWMKEEASRYHGYRDGAALPSIGYRAVRMLTVFDSPGLYRREGNGTGHFDYASIVQRLGGRAFFEENGIKEVWVEGWHHGEVYPVESNMSSAGSGDVSNSYREDDLPIYAKSFTLYNYNFTRSVNLHNEGHQIESQMGWLATRQDGNDRLWWNLFCGRNNDGSFRRGRAGNCHFPPNGERDYDYFNPTPVASDAADWRPDGGATAAVNRTTWESVPYSPTTGDRLNAPGTYMDGDAHWYLWWMQNFPGRGAVIPYGSGRITNWWRAIGDWDGMVRDRQGLWTP